MHTFDVYWLWLCLCVLFWFCWLEPKQNSELFGVFFALLCARIRNYTSLKASARWKALILLASSWCLSSWTGLRRRRRRWLKTTRHLQHSFRRASGFLFFDFCWPRGSFDFALLSDRICIYCLQRLEGSLMLGIHKNRTETAGVHTSPW